MRTRCVPRSATGSFETMVPSSQSMLGADILGVATLDHRSGLVGSA